MSLKRQEPSLSELAHGVVWLQSVRRPGRKQSI